MLIWQSASKRHERTSQLRVFLLLFEIFRTVSRCPGRCVLRQARSKGPKITKTRAKPQIWVELN